VDYGSAESLKNAINGADVVISTLSSNPASLQAQHLLAEQAKAAGVKLFVPSEFGDATDRENLEGVFAIKQSVHRKLKELDLPYALFFTGPHSDFVFIPYAPSSGPWVLNLTYADLQKLGYSGWISRVATLLLA
jgi:uncharacterized protein YbjT (DUF2867 family)